ncbi:MAG: hypothetical protein K9M54_12185 [Kiritimatiellales bacterium]|nr:hypothetical protein [Kiritimatiellales bacterium]
MKTSLKVMATIFALGFVILLGLHLFLQHGLTKAMREVVLPRVKAETGIDVRVGGLSINVASGVMYLKAVEIKNPDGFLLENLASIDRVAVEVDIPSLLRHKTILVKNIEVADALLNVIRNKAGAININQLQAGLPQPATPVPDIGKPVPEKVPGTGETPAPSPVPAPPESKPLPEMLIQVMHCKAQVRYLDLKLNQLDIALDLNVIGSNLSTQRDPSTPWGDIAVIGSLGNDHTSFVTDLKIRLAPVINPQTPSFDLTGKVLEIDPRIMDEAYRRLGIRSAPFGLDPDIHCRDGWFQNSMVVLNLKNIVFKDKLAKQLGGMGSISALRFPIMIEGPLQQPEFDLSKMLSGLGQRPADLAASAVDALGKKVSEIGGSEATKKVLKDLAGGGASDTNAPSPVNSDVLVDILGEKVKEVGENKELKDELKNLGKRLFGK